MSFLIRPMESPTGDGTLVCCIDGKSPTEADDLATYLSEETVDNGDNTHTTTWTWIGGDVEELHMFFKLCCADKITISWTSHLLGTITLVNNGSVEDLGPEDDFFEHIVISDADTWSSTDGGDGGDPYSFEVGPCGMSVDLGWFPDNGSGSFSITY